jgi:hypothetical protein
VKAATSQGRKTPIIYDDEVIGNFRSVTLERLMRPRGAGCYRASDQPLCARSGS